MKKIDKVLIDSVYINSGGGKIILIEVINKLEKLNLLSNFFFLFDKRLEKNKEIPLKTLNHKFILAKEKLRNKFYKEEMKTFSSFVCLSNVPPPIFISKPVHVFFHNDLLLDPFSSNLSLKNKVLNFLKKQYIISRNNKKYNWYVQSNLMYQKGIKHLRLNSLNLNITPIFKEKKITYSNKELNSFLYVSNGSKHKNHKRLFLAFIKAANKTSSVIKLNLTLSNNEFVNSPYSKITAPKNLKILNHGILEFSKLEKVYKKTQFLIFPSLNESFGLPLIESINYNCKVLAPNLDYVNEVIMPSIKFDPFSISNLSESIIFAITKNNIKHSKIIVENKIDTFVKYISNNV